MFNQQQAQEIINRRRKIVADYCKQKGWDLDPDGLSFERVLEIRRLEEWKNVPAEVLKESNS